MSEPTQEAKSPLKNPFVYSTLIVGIVALYVGWTQYSRWQSNREYDRHARETQVEKQREQDKATVEQMGGSELAIQSFYATPVIPRGESGQLCYGVANAKTVTLDPASGPMWPSYGRCIDVKPSKTTTYTLTATDAAGHTASQSVTIKVQ